MIIRKATTDDITRIMRLERECTTAAHWTEQQYEDLFSAARTVNRLALVAERAAELDPGSGKLWIAGFLVARHLPPEWELENVVVAPEARRIGLGKQLLQALLAAARDTHSDAVFLEVRESNIAARTLYEKLGFRQTGRRKSYYANPLEDAVLYRCAVG